MPMDSQLLSKTVISLFEEQVAKTPDNIAISYQNQSLNYHELKTKVDVLADQLGTLPQFNPDLENIIAIYLDRSIELIVAMLAILKVNATYMLIDIEYPASRVDSYLIDSEASIIISNSKIMQEKSILQKYSAIVLCTENINSFKNIKKIYTHMHPNKAAYIVYTSGSTGKPKGIVIEHCSLTNVLLSFKEYLWLQPQTAWLSVTSPSFDIFALEIFLPLISGLECVLYERNGLYNIEHLKDYLLKIQPTVMQATPSLWSLLSTTELPYLPKMTVLCGGEQLSPTLARKLKKSFGRVFNVYGPSETTIWSTYYEITSEFNTICIGKPIKNTSFFILDSNLEPVNVGDIGTLYIGGIGVARGYHNNKELTDRSFIRLMDDRQRFYNTGDLALLLDSGNIRYIGRADNQIKLNGYRIEIEEIEKNVSSIEGILQNCVFLSDRNQTPQLALYYVVEEKYENLISSDIILSQLQNMLPRHMIPSRTHKIDKFPLNNNGKVNRKLLAEYDKSQYNETELVDDDIEEAVTKIWKAVLDKTEINVNENFIIIGGNSIHVPQIITKINNKFNSRITMRDFMDNQTIKLLSQKVKSSIL